MSEMHTPSDDPTQGAQFTAIRNQIKALEAHARAIEEHVKALEAHERAIEKQSEWSRRFTIGASLVLVPTLIVGFFGQNFAPNPLPSWWWGVSLGLIAGATVAQLAFFRWKKWI